uniref:SPASM domain-containing protein n=1 Tax=uncultured Sulfitobacter sp. TaxID=191468 RepID=UPI0025E8448E
EKIELWGGEPFLYWAKIKRLIPALSERFPGAQFLVITNGSLLDTEKLDFIARYDICVGISHDGPGQHLRGPDPLDDPEKSRWIKALLAERPGKTSFNAVLTRDHHDLQALKAWFADKVGPDVSVGLEGVVNVYDAATAIGTGRFEPAELNSLTWSIFEALVEDPNAFGLGERVNEFYKSIIRRRPIEALGQKCGMDREDTIAVDLRGNVMTCQNTGAKGAHKIGHVADFDAIALDTATHFAFRPECMSCPVVQLCKGSCMFLEGDFFAQSCANEFAFNMGIMMAAVWHLTGTVVVGISRQI